MVRGRPPTYCQEINGKMYVTPETLDKEVQRLEKHRIDCRNRYRQKRDMLRKLRPDLFNKVNGCTTNRNAIRVYGVSLDSLLLQSSEEEGCPRDDEGHSRGTNEISISEASHRAQTKV